MQVFISARRAVPTTSASSSLAPIRNSRGCTGSITSAPTAATSSTSLRNPKDESASDIRRRRRGTARNQFECVGGRRRRHSVDDVQHANYFYEQQWQCGCGLCL